MTLSQFIVFLVKLFGGLIIYAALFGIALFILGRLPKYVAACVLAFNLYATGKIAPMPSEQVFVQVVFLPLLFLAAGQCLFWAFDTGTPDQFAGYEISGNYISPVTTKQQLMGFGIFLTVVALGLEYWYFA
jgi:hypothetical protein